MVMGSPKMARSSPPIPAEGESEKTLNCGSVLDKKAVNGSVRYSCVFTSPGEKWNAFFLRLSWMMDGQNPFSGRGFTPDGSVILQFEIKGTNLQSRVVLQIVVDHHAAIGKVLL